MKIPPKALVIAAKCLFTSFINPDRRYHIQIDNPNQISGDPDDLSDPLNCAIKKTFLPAFSPPIHTWSDEQMKDYQNLRIYFNHHTAAIINIAGCIAAGEKVDDSYVRYVCEALEHIKPATIN